MEEISYKFSEALRNWHLKNPRSMPWKKDRDPYKIWLSEIILQQTRVEQGTPYFNRILKAFPDVFSLANAEIDEVFKLWEGLGYYSRARNLHKTSKIIVAEYKGNFPSDYNEILKLPGIGPYTTAAILSFAFEQNHAVVDGNVYRVLSRIFGIQEPVDKSYGKRVVKEIADALIEIAESPSDHNQAIMNFGALQCIPKSPNCKICPASNICVANKQNEVHTYPVKSKAKAKKIRYLNFLMPFNENEIAIEKRQNEDIWKGLYQFPLIETPTDSILHYSQISQQLSSITKQFICFKPSVIYKHVLSHQILQVRFYRIITSGFLNSRRDAYRIIPLKSLDNYAFPRLLDIYLNKNNIPPFKS